MKHCFLKLVDIRCSLWALVVALLAFSILDSSAVSNDGTSGEGEALFAEEGVPKGWSVRLWNDISKPAGTKDSWVVREGVLHGGEPRGTWLVSEREYENFTLEFEFKLGALGNSGLALRSPLKGDPAFDGME
ncbi:MAG TPA: DUF1080 domain-containing protein, partial [Lacipirellulaceae bacterium]